MFLANTDSIDHIWAALGMVLALPGALFIIFTAVNRLRALSMLGGFIGGVLGFFVTEFIWANGMGSVHLEGAVVLVGTYFVSSVTAMVGALLMSFLFGGAGHKAPRSSQVEY